MQECFVIQENNNIIRYHRFSIRQNYTEMSGNKREEMNNNDDIDFRKTKSRMKWSCSWPTTKTKTLREKVVDECQQMQDLYMERWLEENGQSDDAMSEHFKRVLYHTLIPAFKVMCVLVVQKDVIKDRKQLFDPIDCIAEILYNTNRTDDDWKSSQKILHDPYRCSKKVRPVYPLFWLLTRDEAATKIQALVRGVLSRARINLEDMKVIIYLHLQVLYRNY